MFCLLTCLAVPALLVYFFIKVDSDLTLHLFEKFRPNLETFRGKIIWITGASSGIGESLAYELCDKRVKLILSGTNEERLEKVRNKCIELGLPTNDVTKLRFELSDFSVHDDIVTKAINTYGKIDIMVNNAGKSQRADFQNIDITVDMDLFKVNVFGPLNITRKLIQTWIEKSQQGHVVVMSSLAGVLGLPYSASYTGSKHALHGYFECFRNEVSSNNVAVTVICPGPIATPFLGRAVTDKPGETFGKIHASSQGRMSSERCARLIAIAIANKVPDAWISGKPALFLYYFFVYMPSISKYSSSIIKNTSIFRKVREGGSLKDAKND